MRKTYANRDVAVIYDPSLCIHARKCVEGAPEVFDPSARPWIQPSKADVDRVVEVVARCPTGALQFDRLDGGPPETPPARVTIAVEKGGPLYVRGAVTPTDPSGAAYTVSMRYALCRCGGSSNKPFCDGSHRTTAFEG